MSRLYGFHGNEPTKVECTLVHAQNALIDQGFEDATGLSHGHGWGIAHYPDGLPKIEKKAWAAWHGEHFKKVAARVYARTTIAHVRRATVGPPRLRNTHPFIHGRWAFAHNGTVPNFQRVRPKLLEAIDPLNRNEIHGSTDSEHIFRYLLTLWGHQPELGLAGILRRAIGDILSWSGDVDPAAKVGLNILWSDGEHLVGSRLNRSLWFLERDNQFVCDICGKSHVHHDAGTSYRAVELASEPLTSETWKGVPNGTIFSMDPDMRLHFEPLDDMELVAGVG